MKEFLITAGEMFGAFIAAIVAFLAIVVAFAVAMIPYGIGAVILLWLIDFWGNSPIM